VERLVLISSSGVYAVPAVATGTPIPEEGPLALDNLYAITKYSAELLTARYSRLSGKPMTAVRLPAVYGPVEAPRESRTRTSTVHQLLVALRKGGPIRVAGAHFSRDWIYAQDVGRAIWSLLRAEQWRYPVYNISSGQLTHFRELVAQFERHGLHVQWVDDPALAEVAMRPSQMRDPLDTTRLREETGFAPAFALAAGIDAIVSAPG
jgi:nucleoside-diphosphate-sugar epimerase